MLGFLAGATTIAYLAAAAFFFRYWRRTSDRFFLAFAAAFTLFGVNQALVHLLEVASEPNGAIYALRVLGFVIIIAAFFDRKAGRSR